jgi:WD40 repeat protein
MNRLSTMLRRGHVPDERLSELAGSARSNATPREQAHLDGCAECRSLLGGFSRADAVLAGPWVDRAVGDAAEVGSVATPGGPVRLHRVVPGRWGGGRAAGRWAVPLGVAALIIGLVATFGLLGLRASSVPGSSGAPSAGGTSASGSPGAVVSPSPTAARAAGTRVVARLPIGQFATFSWSPRDEILLVSDGAGSRLYDGDGNQISVFGPIEGWLDSAHLIGGDGFVSPIADGHVSGPTSNSRVVGSGHGAAAIVVAVPACTCDPIIDWYRDGKYVKAQQKATPYGWSPDGKYVLLGHMDASTVSSADDRWKGPVDVVDFATSRVVATIPGVRGAMAWNPSGTRLAAESDTALEILDIETGKIKTAASARLLGWADDDYVSVFRSGGSFAVVGATPTTPDVGAVVLGWSVPSSTGAQLIPDGEGMATRIATANAKTTLLDLSSAGLVARPDLAGNYPGTGLLHSPWSADGRMLALPSADGTSIALISVDPAAPGAVGSALPTPVGSPGALAESDSVVLPGPVGPPVFDSRRNAMWLLGGQDGGNLTIYRYDLTTASLTSSAVSGVIRDAARNRLAIAPDGRLWISAGSRIAIFDPHNNRTHLGGFSVADPDIQNDPLTGQPNAWVAGIAFDADGSALVARNWVKSLLRLNGSMSEIGRIQVSDGFPMTGDVVVAGGRVFVGVDPDSGLVIGVDASGSATLPSFKLTAAGLAAVGDKALIAGSPPAWFEPDGSSQLMIGPVLASADLVAGCPGGVSALYSRAAGEIQWRDADGRVSSQVLVPADKVPQIKTLAFDGSGRLWAVESAAGFYSLVRLAPPAAPLR